MTASRSRMLLSVLSSLAFLPAFAFAQVDERIIYASVVDKKGAPVVGLGEKDFLVREDGMAREILSAAPDRDPMQIALLVDDSRTMRGHENLLRSAVSAFIHSLRADIMIALIGVGERPTIRSDYTRDRTKLLKAAGELWGHGWNTLSDGIFESAAGLAKRPLLRPVIVAVSAGGGGNKHRLEVLEALQWSQAMLHAVTVSSRNAVSSRLIQEATTKTGGRDDAIMGVASLEAKLVDLATEISNQYRVTFARPQRLIPPKSTKISARNPDLRARGMLVMTEKERQNLRFAWAENVRRD